MRQITIEFSDEEHYRLLIYAVLKDMRVDAICRDLVLSGLKDFDHESVDILPKLRRLNQNLKLMSQILTQEKETKKD